MSNFGLGTYPASHAVNSTEPEWVLVPKEPTREMLAAIGLADWRGSKDLNWADGYRIMVDAAPVKP